MRQHGTWMNAGSEHRAGFNLRDAAAYPTFVFWAAMVQPVRAQTRNSVIRPAPRHIVGTTMGVFHPDYKETLDRREAGLARCCLAAVPSTPLAWLNQNCQLTKDFD